MLTQLLGTSFMDYLGVPILSTVLGGAVTMVCRREDEEILSLPTWLVLGSYLATDAKSLIREFVM